MGGRRTVAEPAARAEGMTQEYLEVRHYALWTAIDDLAVQVNLRLSALAKHAGLDACTLNPSKRTRGGVLHYPSTPTIGAILAVTETSWGEFGHLVDSIEKARLTQCPGTNANDGWKEVA